MEVTADCNTKLKLTMSSAQPLTLRNPGHQSHDSRSQGNTARVSMEHGRNVDANSMLVARAIMVFEMRRSKGEVRSDV
jgi:hypothetical protein